MRAALGRENVVGEGKHVLRVAVVPLKRHFDGGRVLHALDVNGLFKQAGLVLVQVFHEGDDAALVVIFLFQRRLHALVADGDANALVEERHLAEAGAQGVKIEIAGFKDAGLGRFVGLHVRPELHRGARAVGLAHDLQVVQHLAALVFLLVHLAVLIDVHLQVARQRVHDRRAHAVQAAGNLVAAAAELAARVQHRQAHLDRGAADLGMNADREAAAVVLYGYAAVGAQPHVYIFAIARQRLVHGVVHDLIHQMVQAALVGGADVHAGTTPDGLKTLQNLNVALVVMRVFGHAHNLLKCRFSTYLIIARFRAPVIAFRLFSSREFFDFSA